MKNEFSLDTALATDLVMPLLAYAELLKQSGAYAQSRLLLTLVEDLDRKLMASAAYWVSCGAREIAAASTANVGSIGVVAVHQDASKAMPAPKDGGSAVYKWIYTAVQWIALNVGRAKNASNG